MRSVNLQGLGASIAAEANAGLRGNGSGAGFSGLYRELQAEVRQFIESGSGGVSNAATAATAVSPEGWWGQARAAEPAAGKTELDGNAAEFLQAIAPHAKAAAARLGVAPEVLSAQAALESGWGTRPIRRADGSDSHNVFGIKAGGGWRGEVTQVATTEYEQGQPVARQEKFRSYADAGGSFRDLTQLLLDNPRYRGALQTGSDARAYGQALQRGGYATDPAYADKLTRVAARIKAGL